MAYWSVDNIVLQSLILKSISVSSMQCLYSNDDRSCSTLASLRCLVRTLLSYPTNPRRRSQSQDCRWQDCSVRRVNRGLRARILCACIARKITSNRGQATKALCISLSKFRRFSAVGGSRNIFLLTQVLVKMLKNQILSGLFCNNLAIFKKCKNKLKTTCR